jgi:uncharacterized repeat protein (TIGR01451 family)
MKQEIKNLLSKNIPNNMRKLFTLLVLIIVSINSFSQSPNWQWAKNGGGTLTDQSWDIATDAIGNTYVTGYFFSPSITLGSITLTNAVANYTDMFLVKFDSGGNVVWAKSAGGNYSDYGMEVTVDASGNSFVTGRFSSSSITFGSITLTNSGAGTDDMFVVKYDAGGNVIWAKSAGGVASIDGGHCIAVDANGNTYFSGYFSSSSVTFGSTILTNVGGFDMFIVKYDIGGNVIWAKSAGGSNNDYGTDIAVDVSGNSYVIGKFSSPFITFESTTLTNAGDFDMYIVKYDSGGNMVWAKSSVGSSYDDGSGITVDAIGNTYVTGYFQSSSISFGSNTLNNNNNTNGSSDMFIVKYNPSGNVVWAKSEGGSNSEYISSIALDANGIAYVAGYFSSQYIIFGSTTLINVGTATPDIFIVKYDEDGNVVWAKSAGGTGSDYCYGISTDAGGNVYVTGGFSPSMSFGSTILSSIGSGDIFVAKLLNQEHFLHGNIFNDSNLNCGLQSSELRLPTIPILGTPDNLYGISNDTGAYYVGVLDSVNYTFQPLVPQRFSAMIHSPCPVNYDVYLNVNSPLDTLGFDFGFTGTPCFLLRTDVSANRKRRCFRNYTSLAYLNEGLVPANNVEVHVQFAPYDIPVWASLPYTVDATDGSLVFNLGTLNAGQSGSITIIDSIACVQGIVGLTQCTKAWILPPNQCLIDSTTGSGWDQSSIKVSGSCANDTVRFVILNHGSGNMATSSPYRIYANNVLVYTGSFQLAAGDSLVVYWFSNGATIRLEADQIAGHPGNSHPRATVEACGTNSLGQFTTGQVNLAPMDDIDVDVEIDCLPIRDSYDPNEKLNSPEGISAQHYVLPNTPIDYVIHFQNTGTDTAYKVVVIDTLSNNLDLSTLELGASSFPYTTSLSGQGVAVLKFTFNNINLTDTVTNELQSHGFVNYKIKPKASTPIGTVINNYADIYFDYNFPIRTNDAFVTLWDVNSITTAVQSMKQESGNLEIYPNPCASQLKIKNYELEMEGIRIYNVLGEVVLQSKINNPKSEITLDVSALQSGIYFIQLTTINQQLTNKKFVKE